MDNLRPDSMVDGRMPPLSFETSFPTDSKKPKEKKGLKKKLLRFYRWIIISVTFQLMVLIFVDSFILGNLSTVVTSVDTEFDAVSRAGTKIQIPEQAEMIKLSYDMKYLCYMEESKLVVFDIDKEKEVDELDAGNKKITRYRWMDDRNILIYATKERSSGFSKVTINTYDFDNKQDRSLPEIGRLPENAEINAIEFSHLTNVIYAKIDTGKEEKIYSYDIMGELQYVGDFPTGTIMRETNFTDHLIIDEQNGKLRFKKGGSRSFSTFLMKENLSLLSIDPLDNVYTGVIDQENRITTVRYGKFENGAVKEWKDLKLPKPTMYENILITGAGKVFVNDNFNKTITEVGGTINKKYEGRVIEIRDNAYTTVQNGKLKIINLS